MAIKSYYPCQWAAIFVCLINCIPESFNTNISHQLFEYKITLVIPQHKNAKFKGDFYSKTGLNVCLKDFWYTKIKLRQKCKNFIYILKNP